MDKDIMRGYYRNYYSDPQTEAIKECEEYKEKRNIRYSIEEKMFECLEEKADDLKECVEKYLDAYTDELEILLEEMYLLGANDREKMLRGVL